MVAARALGIKADKGPAEKLPYPDHTFEAVFSNAALHWVRGQDEMLSQVRRVLRPGGRFVAEMGGHGNIAAIRVAFAAVLARHGFAPWRARQLLSHSEAYSAALSVTASRSKKIVLFPRPTPLNDSGMTGWLNTFYRGALDALPEESARNRRRRNRRPARSGSSRHDGHWTADYVRLRFIATV
jgi:SAM-dependent methyltransferase